MTAKDLQHSINLQGQRSLLSRTPWCSVLGLPDDKVPQQTPMSVLSSTPDTTPNNCHTLLWLLYPVASAGCVHRPHPLGVGPFKLQLQLSKQTSCLPQFAPGWSCNLKGMNRFLNKHLGTLSWNCRTKGFATDPDAGVESLSSLINTDSTAAHRC